MKDSWRDGLEHWSTPVMANLLWVFVSVFIITIPLALVGLFGVMFRWTTGGSPQALAVFFNTIRKTWYKAYLAAALDLGIGAVILLNLRIFEFMDAGDALVFLSRSVTVSIAILLVMINLYLWVLIAVWDAPFLRLLKLSVQLVFVQPFWTLVIAVGVAAVIIFSTFLPVAAFVIAAGAVVAYIASKGFWFVVTKYILPSEVPLLDLF